MVYYTNVVFLKRASIYSVETVFATPKVNTDTGIRARLIMVCTARFSVSIYFEIFIKTGEWFCPDL
jgi:hypothetical protein